jgi:hypothetical protein
MTTAARSYQDANAPIGQLLGPLNLVEIFGGVVVDRGPEQLAQILKTGCGRHLRRMGLDRGQLASGAGGKIRLKAVLDHRGMGRGNKIEVYRMAIRHGKQAPSR